YPLPGYTTCRGHIEIGYNSNDANTVDAQISDMLRRGFDGISIAWYGPPQGTCPGGTNCTHDGTTQKVRDNLDGRCSGLSTCPMSFLLRVNEDTWKTCSSGTNQASCILTKVEAALDYDNTNYFGHVSYLKVTGRPVVSFFDEGGLPTACTSTS